MREGNKSVLTKDGLYLIYAYQNILKMHGKFSDNFLDSYKYTKTVTLAKLPQKVLEIQEIFNDILCIRTKTAVFLYYLS